MQLFKDWMWAKKESEVPELPLDEEKEHPALFYVDDDDISNVRPKTEILRIIDTQKRSINKGLKVRARKECYIDDGMIIIETGSHRAEIELSDLDSPLKVLQWYFHLSTKNKWMTKRLLEAFVYTATSFYGFSLNNFKL